MTLQCPCPRYRRPGSTSRAQALCISPYKGGIPGTILSTVTRPHSPPSPKDEWPVSARQFGYSTNITPIPTHHTNRPVYPMTLYLTKKERRNLLTAFCI